MLQRKATVKGPFHSSVPSYDTCHVSCVYLHVTYLYVNISEIVRAELVASRARGRRPVAAARRHGTSAAIVSRVFPTTEGRLAARVGPASPMARGRGGSQGRDLHLPCEVPRLCRGVRVTGHASLRGSAKGA